VQLHPGCIVGQKLPLAVFLSAQSVCAFCDDSARVGCGSRKHRKDQHGSCCDITEAVCVWLWEGFLLLPDVTSRGVRAVLATCTALWSFLPHWERENCHLLHSHAGNEDCSVQPRKASSELPRVAELRTLSGQITAGFNRVRPKPGERVCPENFTKPHCRLT